jgi:hypothetical protein
MTKPDEFTRAAIVAGRTVRRLEREGHSSAEAKQLVKAVINSEEEKLVRHGEAFDAARCIRRLDRLPHQL